jgi:hypothetical protein
MTREEYLIKKYDDFRVAYLGKKMDFMQQVLKFLFIHKNGQVLQLEEVLELILVELY